MGVLIFGGIGWWLGGPVGAVLGLALLGIVSVVGSIVISITSLFKKEQQ